MREECQSNVDRRSLLSNSSKCIRKMAQTRSVSVQISKTCGQVGKEIGFINTKGGNPTPVTQTVKARFTIPGMSNNSKRNIVDAYRIDNNGFRTVEKPKIASVSSADGAFGYMTPATQAEAQAQECCSPRMCYDSTSSLLLELDLGIDMDNCFDKSCFLELAIETLQSDDHEIELSPTLLRIVPNAKPAF